MARIRHIAMTTKEPAKVAEFYKSAFGLKELRRSTNGAVFLTDGHINIAILNHKTEKSADVGAHGPNFNGIHHFGFEVDDPVGGDSGLGVLADFADAVDLLAAAAGGDHLGDQEQVAGVVDDRDIGTHVPSIVSAEGALAGSYPPPFLRVEPLHIRHRCLPLSLGLRRHDPNRSSGEQQRSDGA